jgi:hypothetical protein
VEANKLQELINQLWKIRKRCQDYGNALEAKLGVNTDDLRCACFAMIFNKCTLTIELLDFYKGIWAKRQFVVKKENFEQDKMTIEQARKENGERCIEQTKMFFIAVLSCIEFCAKESIKHYPNSNLCQTITQLAARKRIYLIDLIRESSNEGLISAQDKYKWERLIWLRNLFVHNNGIADNNDVYTIDAVTINLTNGMMIQGDLCIFANLVNSLVELYNVWINTLDQP